jgi:hypothetical protein
MISINNPNPQQEISFSKIKILPLCAAQLMLLLFSFSVLPGLLLSFLLSTERAPAPFEASASALALAFLASIAWLGCFRDLHCWLA